jgi:hypothetical protein
VLYQLSYSREQTAVLVIATSHGGEGNRTPDLLNAIQALSQLSYTPGTVPTGSVAARQEPRRISKGSIEVKKFAMAISPTASILQRFVSQIFQPGFSITKERFRLRVLRLSNQTHSLALLAGRTAAFA